MQRSRACAKRMAPSGPTARVEPAGVPEVIEVRDGLAHREEPLLQVELAPEQHRHQVGGGHRPAAARRRLGELGEARRVMRAQLRDARGRCRGTAARATAAPACRRAAPRTRRANRGSGASGSPSGSTGHTLTLVLILRQQHVAGDQHAGRGRSTATRARASGRGRRSRATSRPPAAIASPSQDPGESRRAARARRAGSGCRAPARPARCSAARPWRANSATSRGVVVPAVAVATARARSGTRRASSPPARRSAAASQAALPTWSGWQWVAMIRCGVAPAQRRREAAFPRARASARRRSRSRPASRRRRRRAARG